jgi:hypothetical protein
MVVGATMIRVEDKLIVFERGVWVDKHVMFTEEPIPDISGIGRRSWNVTYRIIGLEDVPIMATYDRREGALHRADQLMKQPGMARLGVWEMRCIGSWRP